LRRAQEKRQIFECLFGNEAGGQIHEFSRVRWIGEGVRQVLCPRTFSHDLADISLKQ